MRTSRFRRNNRLITAWVFWDSLPPQTCFCTWRPLISQGACFASMHMPKGTSFSPHNCFWESNCARTPRHSLNRHWLNRPAGTGSLPWEASFLCCLNFASGLGFSCPEPSHPSLQEFTPNCPFPRLLCEQLAPGPVDVLTQEEPTDPQTSHAHTAGFS